MKKIKLKIISQPPQNSCAIIKFEKQAKFIGKKGDSYLYCGNCDNELAEKIEEEQIRNIVFLCKCGSYNVVPLSWSTFKLVDIKEKPKYFIIFLGVGLIILSSIFPKFFGYIGFGIGIICAVIGALMFMFTTKKIKYLE